MNNSLTIPFSIVVAGALIAGALIFINRGQTAAVPGDNNPQAENIVIEPVSSDDHILGNPNAPIVIVEFSDTECPFCKQFHTTMQRIMDEYGADGKVAWVYRHFPIDQLHQKARKEAEATECAAELGGNTGFWTFTDRLYEITPSNDGLDLSELPEIAEFAGLDRAAFNACLQSGKYASKIQDHYDQAVAAGGQGTPHSVILTGGQTIPIAGAYPYANMRSIIETILANENAPEGTGAVPAVTP